MGNISKSLQEKRFSQKFKHTLNVKKYDGEMWNSDDVQFFALWQDGTNLRRSNYVEVCLDIFGWTYYLRNPKEGLTKIGGIRIRHQQAEEFRNFLGQKPAGVDFLIPDYQGNYHLSFAKRGLFGQTELRWIFLYSQEHWNNCNLLPAKEGKALAKDMKAREQREKFWFTETEFHLLGTYLDMVLP